MTSLREVFQDQFASSENLTGLAALYGEGFGFLSRRNKAEGQKPPPLWVPTAVDDPDRVVLRRDSFGPTVIAHAPVFSRDRLADFKIDRFPLERYVAELKSGGHEPSRILAFAAVPLGGCNLFCATRSPGLSTYLREGATRPVGEVHTAFDSAEILHMTVLPAQWQLSCFALYLPPRQESFAPSALERVVLGNGTVFLPGKARGLPRPSQGALSQLLEQLRPYYRYPPESRVVVNDETTAIPERGRLRVSVDLFGGTSDEQTNALKRWRASFLSWAHTAPKTERDGHVLACDVSSDVESIGLEIAFESRLSVALHIMDFLVPLEAMRSHALDAERIGLTINHV